jgi:type IV pilus assembly protein PilV
MNLNAATCSSIDVDASTGGGREWPADQKGYTLIEVMIAIVIFAVGILAAWALQHSSTRGNTTARNLTLATACASDRLEQLIQLPYGHADLVAGTVTPSQALDGIDNNFNGEIDEAGESGSLTISWQITDNTPMAQTKTIRVNVNMRQRTVSVTSYRTDL